MLTPVLDFCRRANSKKGDVARALAQDSRRSFWAFADQGIVSLGNFGINIVLARHFAQTSDLTDYGKFWVLMELILFLNGVQAALLIYPLSVRGAVLDRRGLAGIATQSLLLTFLIGPLLVLMLCATAVIAHMSIIVGLWAGIALVMWQSQEALRRTLMAHLRFRAAMLGDTISYLGQFAVIIWLAEHNSLTLTTAFQTMALTSALSAILQASQIGLQKTSINQLLSFSKECWSTGRWVLFGNLTDFFSGAMFSWNLAYWAGYEMLGIYNALTNLLRLANPVSLTIGTLITPTAARAHERSGEERAKIVAIRFTLLGGLLLAPYLGLLIIWPKLLIALFYSWNSPYMIYAPVVQIFAAAVAFVYLAISAGAFLNAVHRTRQAFVGQLIYATGFLFVVMPLTAQFGLYGAAWGWLAIASIRAGIYFYFVGSLMPDERQRHDLPLEQQPEMAGIGQIE